MDYKSEALQVRKDVLRMIHKAGTSHIASNFSAVDLAVVLYNNLGPDDEVVWSAGWKAALIYRMLAKQGKIPFEDLEKFPHEPYFGLAETSVNGVLVNGGSVGHGLSVAVGIALGKKQSGNKGRVYCIMSDGEMNEGSTWEAVMSAGHHKLGNLYAIIDKNGWQAMGKCEDVLKVNAGESFRSFGWNTSTIDGHDYDEIYDALIDQHITPRAIIANTIKGKGVSFMEDHLTFHYKNIDDETYEKALKELV